MDSLIHNTFVKKELDPHTWDEGLIRAPLKARTTTKARNTHILVGNVNTILLSSIKMSSLRFSQRSPRSETYHWEVCNCRHDDVIKWKNFPSYWPFVRGIHRSPVNSPHKGQWREALMFSLISARINGWVNNDEAGDLRRHRAHYDVSVISHDWRCQKTAKVGTGTIQTQFV